MRVRTVAGGLTVNAVAGSYVVVLGLNVDDALRSGLRGFAIQREDKTEGETRWMKGTKTFASVEAHPTPGELFSSLEHPYQTFQWQDGASTSRPARSFIISTNDRDCGPLWRSGVVCRL